MGIFDLFSKKNQQIANMIDEYNSFCAKTYLCSENGMKYVCIHRESKALYFYKVKQIQTEKIQKIFVFDKQPVQITTYEKLIKNLSDDAIKFYRDLNKANWKSYFGFMLLDSESDGEVLKKQLLSCDKSIVRNAACKIVDYTLKNPSERKALLAPSYESIDMIEKNAKNLDLGGMFADNKRFLYRAIEIIKGNNSDKCFCRLVIDRFGTNANGLVKHGFMLIQANERLSEYSYHGVVECPICHKKYEIIEEYTGWHISTCIHCIEL